MLQRNCLFGRWAVFERVLVYSWREPASCRCRGSVAVDMVPVLPRSRACVTCHLSVQPPRRRRRSDIWFCSETLRRIATPALLIAPSRSSSCFRGGAELREVTSDPRRRHPLPGPFLFCVRCSVGARCTRQDDKMSLC